MFMWGCVSRQLNQQVNICPECGFDRLYGPVSDFWGQACPECGWFKEYQFQNGESDDDKNGDGDDDGSFD